MAMCTHCQTVMQSGSDEHKNLEAASSFEGNKGGVEPQTIRT